MEEVVSMLESRQEEESSSNGKKIKLPSQLKRIEERESETFSDEE
jgi:hypothetical protein